SAVGGTFVLKVNGQPTADIAYNASAAALRAALGAAADVSGAGTVSDPWRIAFPASVTSLTIDNAGLRGTVPVTVKTTQQGTATKPEKRTLTLGGAVQGSFRLLADGVNAQAQVTPQGRPSTLRVTVSGTTYTYSGISNIISDADLTAKLEGLPDGINDP